MSDRLTTRTLDVPRAAIDLTLRDLTGRGIPLAVLRPPARDGRNVLEVDVLVAPAHLAAAEDLLRIDGFRRRPGWGRDPHRFWIRPLVGEAGLDWLKLDLVTDLAFGPWHEWGTGTADEVLADRTEDRPPRLAPADELLALALHVALDRGAVRPRDGERLQALAARAERPGALARAVLADGGDGPHWDDIRGWIVDGRWATLLAAAPALRARIVRGRVVRGAARRARNRALRRTAPLWTARAGRAPLVAVVGPDGTGKTTLTDRVAREAGLPARCLYGGTYGNGVARSTIPGVTSGRVVRRLLGTRVRLAWHRRRGRLVVLDRHPLEAAPRPEDDLSARARLRRSTIARTLPDPDLLVVLDAPAPVLHRRRPEHSIAHLESDRVRHLALAGDGGATVIDATGRPDAVRDRAVSLVWELIVPSTPGRPSAVSEPA